jgi:hypothetical protein
MRKAESRKIRLDHLKMKLGIINIVRMEFIRNLFARIWSSLLNTSMAKWIIGIFSSPSPHNTPIVQSVGGQQDEKATQQTAQLSREPDRQMSCGASTGDSLETQQDQETTQQTAQLSREPDHQISDEEIERAFIKAIEFKNKGGMTALIRNIKRCKHLYKHDLPELTPENRNKAIFTAIKHQNSNVCTLLLDNFDDMPEEAKLDIILAVIESVPNGYSQNQLHRHKSHEDWIEKMFKVLKPHIINMLDENKVKIFSAAAKVFAKIKFYDNSWIKQLVPLMEGMSLKSERQLFIIACRHELAHEYLTKKHIEVDNTHHDNIGERSTQQFLKESFSELEKGMDFLDLRGNTTKISKDIIKKHQNTNDKEYRLALTHALFNNIAKKGIKKILEEESKQISNNYPEYKFSILLAAIRTKDIEKVKWVKDLIGDINAINEMDNEQKLQLILAAIGSDSPDIFYQVKDCIDGMNNEQKLQIILAAATEYNRKYILDQVKDCISSMNNEQKLQIILAAIEYNWIDLFDQVKGCISNMNNEQKLQIILAAIEYNKLDIFDQVKGCISSMNNEQKLQIILAAIEYNWIDLFDQVKGCISNMNNEQKLQIILAAIEINNLDIFDQVKGYINNMNGKHKLELVLAAIPYIKNFPSNVRSDIITTLKNACVSGLDNKTKQKILLKAMGTIRCEDIRNTMKLFFIQEESNKYKVNVLLAAIKSGSLIKLEQLIKFFYTNFNSELEEDKQAILLAAIESGNDKMLKMVITYLLKNHLLPHDIDESMKEKAMEMLKVADFHPPMMRGGYYTIDDDLYIIINRFITGNNINASIQSKNEDSYHIDGLLPMLRWGAFERLSEDNKRLISIPCLEVLSRHLETNADAALFAVMIYHYIDDKHRKKLSVETREKLNAYIHTNSDQHCTQINKALVNYHDITTNKYKAYISAFQEAADVPNIPKEIVGLILEHSQVSYPLIVQCARTAPKSIKKPFLKFLGWSHTEGTVLAAKEAIGTGHGSEAELEPGL